MARELWADVSEAELEELVNAAYARVLREQPDLRKLEGPSLKLARGMFKVGFGEGLLVALAKIQSELGGGS